MAADGLVDKEQANLAKEQAKKPTTPIQFSTVNTNVTSPNVNTISPQQTQSRVQPQSLPTNIQKQPTSSGITNIPQERINQYTNLFGRL
jgi:hypothetical protein